MALVQFSQLTIPAYGLPPDPLTLEEAFHYLMIQMIRLLKQEAVCIPDGRMTGGDSTQVNSACADIVTGLQKWSLYLLDFATQNPIDINPSLELSLTAFSQALTHLSNVTPGQIQYMNLRPFLSAITTSLSNIVSILSSQGLADLQFSNIELDLESVKLVLAGKNLIASP